MINFLDISYLKSGNKKQEKIYQVLTQNFILDKLASFTPILVGTIPIEIDINTSDLDIICYYLSKNEFIKVLNDSFGSEKGFILTENLVLQSVKANFEIDDFELEIFGQNIPTQEQNAYRHMLIEYNLLAEKGEAFRQQIIELKNQGIKTEPAFAQLLGLEGNAYDELLKLKQ